MAKKIEVTKKQKKTALVNKAKTVTRKISSDKKQVMKDKALKIIKNRKTTPGVTPSYVAKTMAGKIAANKTTLESKVAANASNLNANAEKLKSSVSGVQDKINAAKTTLAGKVAGVQEKIASVKTRANTLPTTTGTTDTGKIIKKGKGKLSINA
jgi:hypothetical protein